MAFPSVAGSAGSPAARQQVMSPSGPRLSGEDYGPDYGRQDGQQLGTAAATLNGHRSALEVGGQSVPENSGPGRAPCVTSVADGWYRQWFSACECISWW